MFTRFCLRNSTDKRIKKFWNLINSYRSFRKLENENNDLDTWTNFYNKNVFY